MLRATGHARMVTRGAAAAPRSRVAGAPEGCRFAAVGPNTVRQRGPAGFQPTTLRLLKNCGRASPIIPSTLRIKQKSFARARG